MTGREKIKAAFSPGGTREFPVVIPPGAEFDPQQYVPDGRGDLPLE